MGKISMSYEDMVFAAEALEVIAPGIKAKFGLSKDKVGRVFPITFSGTWSKGGFNYMSARDYKHLVKREKDKGWTIARAWTCDELLDMLFKPEPNDPCDANHWQLNILPRNPELGEAKSYYCIHTGTYRRADDVIFFDTAPESLLNALMWEYGYIWSVKENKFEKRKDNEN